ncbi:MAG: hypothetical protein PGN07_04735 [Aeromicrobium erythreum]
MKDRDPFPPETVAQAARFLEEQDPEPSIDSIELAMQRREEAIEAEPALMVGNPDRVYEMLRSGLNPLKKRLG